MADLTAGHLLATGVLAALVRSRTTGEGQLVEVSLLGAALAVQIQDLVWLEGEAEGSAAAATRDDLEARADEIAGGLAMNPYYRCLRGSRRLPRASPVSTCPAAGVAGAVRASTTRRSRRRNLLPDDPAVLAAKQELTAVIERAIAAAPVEEWLARLGASAFRRARSLARDGACR